MSRHHRISTHSVHYSMTHPSITKFTLVGDSVTARFLGVRFYADSRTPLVANLQSQEIATSATVPHTHHKSRCGAVEFKGYPVECR